VVVASHEEGSWRRFFGDEKGFRRGLVGLFGTCPSGNCDGGDDGDDGDDGNNVAASGEVEDGVVIAECVHEVSAERDIEEEAEEGAVAARAPCFFRMALLGGGRLGGESSEAASVKG
jgi:hypothetical protein